jgi:hypothetical protein
MRRLETLIKGVSGLALDKAGKSIGPPRHYFANMQLARRFIQKHATCTMQILSLFSNYMIIKGFFLVIGWHAACIYSDSSVATTHQATAFIKKQE